MGEGFPEQTMISSDKYSFHMEPLRVNLESIKTLLKDNHDETGIYNLPFNPDYQRYLDLAGSGDLVFFTVRDLGRGIVGFALFFLDHAIQQKEIKIATQSLNFIAKQHRGIGLAFMRFCDDSLKDLGVNSVWRQASTKFDIGPIYERMGYEFIEKSYLRRL